MAKHNKQQQQSTRLSLLDCEIRPATKTDKWCDKRVSKGKAPDDDAPYGYIITIPYCPNKNTFLDGIDSYIIVRSKKHCGVLLLQIIRKDFAPPYGIKSFARQEPKTGKRKRKNKKKLYRILNIRNLAEGKW